MAASAASGQHQTSISRLLQSKGLAPQDVLNAVALQTPILPSGGAKIGQFEYDVHLRANPSTVDAYNDIPLRLLRRRADLTCATWRTSATVSRRRPTSCAPGRPPRRADERAPLKAGSASTLDVVSGIRRILPRAVRRSCRRSWSTQPLADRVGARAGGDPPRCCVKG